MALFLNRIGRLCSMFCRLIPLKRQGLGVVGFFAQKGAFALKTVFELTPRDRRQHD